MGGIVKAVVGVVTDVVDGLFGGGKQAAAPAPAPVVAKPTVMPTPDDAAIAAAKKKSIAAIVNRQGRASTILSGDSGSDPLGS